MSALEVVRAGAPAEAGRPSRRAGDAVLAVDGTFDLPAAMRTAAAARAATASARVTVDLRRARIEDVALAAFVREVAGRPVVLVGISRHHERLLRYLEEGAGAARARRGTVVTDE